MILRNHSLAVPTSGESFGFIDGPLFDQLRHSPLSSLFQRGTKCIGLSLWAKTKNGCGY